MFFVIASLWFISQFKALLFWLYLWQLKEYHIGRFIDHFRTAKGKSLVLNPVLALKVVLLPFLWFFPLLWIVLLALYALEFLRIIRKRKVFRPSFTLKTLLLTLLGALVMVVFAVSVSSLKIFAFWLLLFDVLSPVLFSLLVLFLQPLVVFQRNRIISRARNKRNGFKGLKVVGITGSYGKTSTKEFLAHILSKRFNVLKTKAHQNSEVGVSRAILEDLTQDHEVFVCEMGAYNKGGISLLAGIAKPHIGVISGINEQHMATFGSQENIIQAKFELIDALPQGGIAILNKDSENVKKEDVLLHNKGLQKVVWCSTKDDSEVSARNIKVKKDKVSFLLVAKEKVEVSVPVIGAHNVQNILLAVAVALELGMSFDEIAKALLDIPKELSAMQVHIDRFNVIDSSYSANPDGVLSDLEYLKLWQGPKAVIMPSLIELGKASKSVHERIGRKIAEVCDLAIITTKDRFKEMRNGAIESGMDRIVYLDSPKDITQTLKDAGVKTVLLQGRVSPAIHSLFI